VCVDRGLFASDAEAAANDIGPLASPTTDCSDR
jgi:hypothetical protein